jgi:hypothetical protein
VVLVLESAPRPALPAAPRGGMSKVAEPHLLMSIPTPRARDRCAERNIGALSTMCASEAGRSGLELRYKVNGSADMTDTALVRA